MGRLKFVEPGNLFPMQRQSCRILRGATKCLPGGLMTRENESEPQASTPRLRNLEI
jgi:hypothetical protein